MEGERTCDIAKKGVFVWRESHDIYLLRRVLTLEPYKYRFGSKERGSAWTTIAENLEGFGMKVSQRSVRERFNRMIDAFKKKEADEKRASGVDVEFTEKDQALLDIMERMEECEVESEQEKQKELKEKETAEEMRKRAVERLGETRKRAGVSDKENGGTPDGNRKRNGEIVEVLKESIKATKEKEEAERQLRERDMNLREQHLAMQQQFQQGLLEQQQQFQLQQQAMTMAFVNAMTELVKNINK